MRIDLERSRAMAGVLAALCATLLAGCEANGAGGGVAIGEPVPAYAAPTLEGDSLALADLQGSPVLLNLWATWCGPCREEMPDLQALHEDYRAAGLRVVGVSIDQASAGGAVRTFLDEHAITFTVLHDPQGRITRMFRTVGVPETFLIGADGRLVARWIGPIDPAVVRQTIDL